MIAILIGFIASVVGFFISRYISQKVRTKSPLMCPRSAPCDEVVTSTYGKTFGISNARLGQLYYVLVAFLFLALMDGISFPLQLVFMMIVVSAGIVFSLYLMYVQAFILRKWCVWCLLSAVSGGIVFVCTMYFAYGVIHR